MSFLPGPVWGPWIISGAGCALTLTIGGLLTEIGPWYRHLRKPRWQPPDLLFGPAWTLIMALVAWAGVLGWRHAPGMPERVMLISVFLLNFVLNVGWSLFFFKWKRPDWALIEVAPLWLSIGLMMLELSSMSAGAAWLLAPYLAWVTFAAGLNLTIVRLNGRFG